MTQKKVYRMAQINRLLQEEIAGLFLTEMQDVRLLKLTVTEVRTSKDLNHAVVFVTTQGKNNREAGVAVANHAAGYLRKLLFARLHLKRIPALEFRYDESLDRAELLSQTLQKIQTDLEE